MKTNPADNSNELAKQVSDMQNNNELWLYKRINGYATAFNFIGVLCAGISAVGHFNKQEYIFMSLALAVFIFCANSFMQEGIYYTITLPEMHTNKLYKIGDVYFVGANKNEAELYAHIKNLDDEIECISTDCGLF